MAMNIIQVKDGKMIKFSDGTMIPPSGPRYHRHTTRSGICE